jgi:uncharacterized protein (DUF1800 family)
MVIDPKSEAALALHRFGFGPRVGSIAAIAADPRGALLADIDRISDQPGPTLSDKLAERFMTTDGDLKEVAKTLVTAPESWSPTDRKLKRRRMDRDRIARNQRAGAEHRTRRADRE